MANQNQCNFTGRIGNLEIRYTQDKTLITAFSLAISKSRKYNNGQWIDETTWISCKACKEKAEYINNHAQKGSFVRIMATYQGNKWTDKSGQQRISREFLVNDFEILGNRKEKKPQESQDKLGMSCNTQSNNNPVHETDFEDEIIPFQTQEFDTENRCQIAEKQFEWEFETFKDINAKAICVEKQPYANYIEG